MQPIDERAIRGAFVNASLRERNALTLPAEFGQSRWERLDFLGWRDPKLPEVAYVVVELDDGPAAVLLREAERRFRSRPQCSWCEDVHLPNDVTMFSARRAGAAGRNGNTIATLVCDRFQCSANVRKRPPVAYTGFDVDAAVQHRIEVLRSHVRAFVTEVRGA
jgi:hypothetical protein